MNDFRYIGIVRGDRGREAPAVDVLFRLDLPNTGPIEDLHGFLVIHLEGEAVANTLRRSDPSYSNLVRRGWKPSLTGSGVTLDEALFPKGEVEYDTDIRSLSSEGLVPRVVYANSRASVQCGS